MHNNDYTAEVVPIHLTLMTGNSHWFATSSRGPASGFCRQRKWGGEEAGSGLLSFPILEVENNLLSGRSIWQYCCGSATELLTTVGGQPAWCYPSTLLHCHCNHCPPRVKLNARLSDDLQWKWLRLTWWHPAWSRLKCFWAHLPVTRNHSVLPWD